MSSEKTGRRRFEITFPLGISVDPCSLRERVREPSERSTNLLVYSHKPRFTSITLDKQGASGDGVSRSSSKDKWAANFNEPRKSCLREQKDVEDLKLSEALCRDIRVIRKFDDEFFEQMISDRNEMEQLESFSFGELFENAEFEKKRESLQRKPDVRNTTVLTNKMIDARDARVGLDTKSEPEKVLVGSKREGIDFSRSVYKYTKSWKRRHRLATNCASEDIPSCLGDHIPIRTTPLDNLPSGTRNVLESLKPVNLELEKLKFFARDFDYNPQFRYSSPLTQEFLNQYRQPSVKYLQPALTIMKNLIRKYGSYERYEEMTGGRVLQPQEIRALVTDYVQREGFDDGEILLNLSTDILSTAMMTRTGAHGILTVKLGEIHESWIEGMLRHELSTHYLRGKNNTGQPWSTRKSRGQYCLLPHNPTEEGLASLHTVLLRPEPLLFRNALLYFAVVLASTLSFKDLFKKLAEFLLDPERRWDYCVRAKRGQLDTSVPGCFTKDQVYLTGSLNILRNRKRIDFEALMRCGKLAWEDVERVKGLAEYEHTRIPTFMRDMAFYRSRLDFVMKTNGLRDADFKKINSVRAGVENDRIDECRFDL